MLAPAHELDQELFRHPNQSPIGIHKTNYIGQWEKPAIAQDIVAHVMSPAGLIFIICEQTGGAMIRSKDCPSLLPSGAGPAQATRAHFQLDLTAPRRCRHS